MNDEIELLDEKVADDVFYIDSKRLSIYDYLEGVDTVLSKVREGDFELGINTLRSMSSIGHAIGISKAKLLHGMYQIWTDTHKENSDEKFFEYVAEFGLLRNRIVIERYINAWDAFLQAPADFCERLLLQPMKNLNALGAAVSQGYDPSLEDWEELADADSNSEFLETIRKVKGKDPRKNGIQIFLEDDGSIIARNDGIQRYVGSLMVDDDDTVVQKVIERISKGASLIKH